MSKIKYHRSLNALCACLLISCFGFSASDLIDIKREITKQNYKEALILSEEGLNQSPDKYHEQWLSYYRGLSYLRLADFKKSQSVFQGLMEGKLKGGLQDKVCLGLIDAYFLNEEYAAAQSVGEKLLRKSSNSDFLSLIYLKLGRTNMKLTNWQEAHRYLNSVIAQFPDSLEYDLAMQFLEEKQYFAVQVGSFSDRDRAQGLVEELNAQGEYAYFVESMGRQKKMYYRVRVGKMSRLAEAKILESKLSDAGYPTRIYP